MNLRNPNWGFEWYLKCFTFDYATFSGRTRRREFWYFMLFTTIAGLLFSGLDAGLSSYVVVQAANTVKAYGIFGSAYSLAALVPGLAVGWRRLHDVGRSGWLQAIPLVLGVLLQVLLFWMALNAGAFGYMTMIGVILGGGLVVLGSFIWLIVLFARNGTKGTNRFGTNPKGE